MLGTIAGTRGILHTDPAPHAEKRAREPLVSEADAVLLERSNLAKRVRNLPDDDDIGADDFSDDVDVDTRAGIMVEDTVEADQSVDQSTGLDTRQTTAFPKGPEQLKNVTEGEAGDPDSPPRAPRGRPAKARATKKAAAKPKRTPAPTPTPAGSEGAPPPPPPGE